MPLTALDYTSQAFENYNNQDLLGAITACDEAIKLNSNEEDAFSLRAQAKLELAHQNSSNYQDAIADFDTAISLLSLSQSHSMCASMFLGRADAKFFLTRYADAIADCNAAITLDPYSAVAFWYRGNAKQQLNDHQGAIDDFDQAIHLKKNNNPMVLFKILFNRARAKQQLNQHETAITDFNKVIELDSQDPLPLLGRAVSRSALEDHLGAIADCNKALALEPNMIDIILLRQHENRELGNYPAAIADCDRAIQLNSENVEDIRHVKNRLIEEYSIHQPHVKNKTQKTSSLWPVAGESDKTPLYGYHQEETCCRGCRII